MRGFNLPEDHIKCWMWGCKTGESRSELDDFPKEIEIHMCEEGKIQESRRLDWHTRDLNNKRMERKMVSRGEGGKDLGIENYF